MVSTDVSGKGRDLNVTLIDYGIVKTCGHEDEEIQESSCKNTQLQKCRGVQGFVGVRV